MMPGLVDPRALWSQLPSETAWKSTPIGSNDDPPREAWELLVVALVRLEWIHALESQGIAGSAAINTRDWPIGWKRWAVSLTKASALQRSAGVVLGLDFVPPPSPDVSPLLQRSFIGDVALRLVGAAEILGSGQDWTRKGLNAALKALGGSFPSTASARARDAAVVFAMRDAYMHKEDSDRNSELAKYRDSLAYKSLSVADWYTAAIGLWQVLATELTKRV